MQMGCVCRSTMAFIVELLEKVDDDLIHIAVPPAGPPLDLLPCFRLLDDRPRLACITGPIANCVPPNARWMPQIPRTALWAPCLGSAGGLAVPLIAKRL